MEVMRIFVVLLLAIPAVAAIIAAAMGPGRWQSIRWVALAATLADLVLAAVLATNFVNLRAAQAEAKQALPTTFQPEFVPGAGTDAHKTTWEILRFYDVELKTNRHKATPAIQFYVGLDGINVWLVVLTALLMVPSVLISWNAIQDRANEYYAWLLALGTGMLGVFLAFDIILFYVFFELTLVPLFFLIGIWGGPERRHAARKFFIYTLAGSLITFLGLLAIVAVCYLKSNMLTFSIPELVTSMRGNLAAASDPEFWTSFQFWVFLALTVGFAIKVPLVPMHTWLPLAHVEAPTAGSVLLAGVLLKLGAYGFLRFCLPLTPDACYSVGVPLIGTLAVIGIIYGALCALAQNDIKKMVAYSSVSHLGFCMLGMFALNPIGLAGSLLQMINHGLSTGALFLLVGMLYERYHTRQMADYGGMGSRLGLLSACMVFICLSSIGLPFLNGFVGETLVFFGAFQGAGAWVHVQQVLAVLGTSGILLGAWYLLTMVKQVFFGPLKEPHHEGAVGDLDTREICALVPIMILCVVLGVYPQLVLDSAKRDLDVVANILEQRTSTRR